MSNFYLNTNFSKPWSIVDINGDCVTWTTEFSSSDTNIWVIGPNNKINVVWVWEVKIQEITAIPDCENTWSILLTSTEDGKPFFISPEDYRIYTNYELIFVFSVLFVAFLIRFFKNS